MSDSRWGSISTLIPSLLAIFFGGMVLLGPSKPNEEKGSPPPENKLPDNSKVGVIPPREKGFKEFICEFFQIDKEKMKGIQFHVDSSQLICSDQISNWKLKSLVVTVPDPIDTSLATHTDRLLDTIQRSLERSGYVLDRSWFPWTQLPSDARFVDPDGPIYRRHPGLMLFRGKTDTGEGSLCVVQLIGETPASGIHVQAFKQALKNLQDTFGLEDFNLVGPFFTGSQVSLEFLLKSALDQNEETKFHIVNGSATGLDPKKLLETPSRVDYSATINRNADVIRATLHFLASPGGYLPENQSEWKIPQRVAFLRESNTGYGLSIQQALQSIPHDSNPILDLSFPLYVSRIRTIYEQARTARENALGIQIGDPLIPRILDRTISSREEGNIFDPYISAASNGKILKNLLETIRREGIRYVGIVATDPRDVVFLVRVVREHFPNVQIFTPIPDIMLTLPEAVSSLRGTIVAGSYPLVSRTRRNNTDDDRVTDVIHFPSQSAEGYYNAIQVSLQNKGKKAALLDTDSPFGGEPQGTGRPPIWISMIDADGQFVPLMYYQRYFSQGSSVRSDNGSQESNSPPLQPYALPSMSLYIFASLILDVLVIYFLYLVLWKKQYFLFWYWTPEQQDCSIVSNSNGCQKLPEPDEFVFWEILLTRVICLASLATIYWPGLLVNRIYLERCIEVQDLTEGFCSFLLLSANVGILVGLLFAVLTSFQPFRPAWRTFRSFSFLSYPFYLGIGSGFIVILSFLGAGFYCWYWHGESKVWQTLFMERATQLTNGISPLMPLTCWALGMFFWTRGRIKRFYLARQYHIASPFPDNKGPSFQRIKALDRILDDQVSGRWHPGSSHPWFYLIIFVALVVSCGRFVIRYLPTVEGSPWDFGFYVGFVLLAGCLLESLWRLLRLWSKLSTLLTEIGRIGMMAAFERIPVRVSKIFGGYLFTNRPRLSHLAIPVHQLELIAQKANQAEFTDRVTAMESTFNDIRGKDEMDGGRERRHFASRLSTFAHEMFGALIPIWRKRTVDECFGRNLVATSSTAPPSPQTLEQLCEEYLATQIVIYISQFFIQLRNHAMELSLSGILLMFATTVYPFHPDRFQLFFLSALILGLVGGLLYVFIKLSRDEILSYITHTTPGRFLFDPGFLSSTLQYVLPMVAILGAQLSGSLSWMLDPITRLFR